MSVIPEGKRPMTGRSKEPWPYRRYVSACPDRTHREHWRVTARRCNYSAFNGYRRTPSDYSHVVCTVAGCMGSWRTKAAYVDDLPDAALDYPLDRT